MKKKSFNFFLLRFLCTYVVACPFKNYEDGLLPPLNPISVENFVFDNGDSIALGYWSFCIPLWEVQRYPTVEQEFDISSKDQGQLFFLVTNNGPLILGYLSFDSINLQVIHNFAFQIPQSNLQFVYSSATYEGQWIFTLLTFMPQSQKIIIEMTDQPLRQITADLSELSEVQFTIGGRGLISINSMQLNLNIFRGRLSKLISEPYNPQNFAELSVRCQIPQKILGQQTIYIVPGFRQFKGDALLQFVIDQVGNRYCLSGWVKYDASSIIYQNQYTLLRLSAFKNYQSNQHFGDDLFHLQVWLHRQFPKLSKIEVYTNPYSIPLQGKADYDYDSEFYIYGNFLYNTSNDYYYEGLQQWHFVQYEYGRTGVNEAKFLLKIQFYNELRLVTSIFGSSKRVASFTNSKFYLFFGGDDDSLELLRAYIYNFKFEYNYNENKQFLFKVCHYSCQECNGPLANNCISCDSNSMRIYLDEQQICKCKSNYIDYDGNMICQPFPQEYQSVIEGEISSEQASQCQQGYFQISDHLCVKCPQQNFNDRLCVDCLYYPLTWFKKPQCTIDLVTRKEFNDDAYTLAQRKSIDYDVYVIDEANNLLLLEGVLDFCFDNFLSYCHQTNYLHLGQLVSVICKDNYYFWEQKCLKIDPQCLKTDLMGVCLQCLDGMYLKENFCFECPLTCSTCKYDQLSEQIICESCYDRYTVVIGQCIECGSYCSICRYYQDQLLNTAYIRCFKCVDDSLYLLSLDGQNCLLNPIEHCLYAFQGLYSDITINTLDYYYQPQEDSEDVVTFCGLCENPYIFVFETLECVRGFISNCDFGYSDYSDFNYQTQVCLISQLLWSTVIQFNNYCQGYSPNCGTCLKGKPAYFKEYMTCLICSRGYYSERLSGKCYTCPEDLHCYQCVQQDSFTQDKWKDNIRAFYRQLIEGDYTHPFIMYGQSQNPDDYEIICSICQPNYEFLGNKCIPSCPESCLECQLINGENICVKCQLEENGRRLSFVNNQCIQCPVNCALCRQRSNEEIININPLFSNSEFSLYTYQCLRSFDNQNYYYDQEIGQFIDCVDFVNGCQKQLIIPINLFCSEIDYQKALNNNIKGKIQFRQSNILLSQLFSGNSFTEVLQLFYQVLHQRVLHNGKLKNDQKYNYKNQWNRTANLLIKWCCCIRIIIQRQYIFSNVNIDSKFSDVELEMQFMENTVLYYDNTISFENFKKITIIGVTLQPEINNREKQVIFSSQLPLTVFFYDLVYQQQYPYQDQSQIIFKNLKSLSIEGLEIINLVQSEQNHFFLIEKTDTSKDIYFSSIVIYKCIISNQIVFLLNLGQNDTVTFTNAVIRSTFYNSSLISSRESINMAQMEISSLFLLVTLHNCQQFFDIYRLEQIMIYQLKFMESLISNSTLFNLNSLATLTEITMRDSKFTNTSIFKNSYLLFDNSFKLILQNVQILNNSYDETTKFILFKKFDSAKSEIEISELYLIGNSAKFILEQYNSDQINSALVSIQFLRVSIREMNIQRGYGLIDISIAEAQSLLLEQVSITQHPDFVFLGLHQYLDCRMHQVQGRSFWQSLYIFQTKQVEITNLEIIGVEIFNYPLILIQSADLGIIQQNESVKIQNILLKSNLLLLSQLTKQTTLLMFESSQDINLIISNATFQDNILHEYVQNQVTDSSALLYIDYQQGFVSITNSLLSNNLVTNSSDSIMHVKSNSILIQRCEFINNSIFKYETLYPYLLWGFPHSQKIYLSDIQSIFPVQSKSGNGILTGATIQIADIIVNNSQGSFGGGFQIIAQNQASISLENCVFSNVNSLFNAQDESGGVIYFDGSNAQSFSFKMYNIDASNIYCRFKGGLLYILAGLSKANIQLISIQSNDVYSSLGSLLFLEFSNLASSSQKLKVKGLKMQNTFQGQINYLNKFTNIFQSEQSILINNRTAIYVNFGDELVFQNISIQNMLIESAFYLAYAIKISIFQLRMTNSSQNKNTVQIIANTYSESNYIIRQFTAFDTQIGQVLSFNQCFSTENQYYQNYFQCLSYVQSPPLLIDNKLKFQNCLINNMNIQQDLTNSGLIVFIDLNELSQLKLDQITFSNIDCQNCENGLISAIYSETDNLLPRLILEQITLTQNQCGKSSCLILGQITNSRILQEGQIYKLGYELIVNHYDCINNTAVNGTCLMIFNLKTLVRQSNFKGNNASISGGAIVVKGNKIFVIEESLIQDNAAFQGGGYFSDQLMMNQTNLKTIIEGNKATFYGNDRVSPPSQMTISFNGKILSTSSITKTEQLCIDQVLIEQYHIISNQIENALYLPTGQEIYNYQYYDWQKSTYIPLKLSIKLLALNQEKIVQKDLLKSECIIQSRQHNIIENYDEIFINNYTNLQKILFNDSTQDYNLDNLIVYFDPQTVNEFVLQLQFSCNSIRVPIHNKEFPYNILDYHQNYYLRLNIRSFPCQLGEIKQNNSCLLCDSTQGLFSIEPNAQKCSVLEDVSTISVRPAQLNIRQGYWRPYLDTILVSYCLNLPENCLGGWAEGDNSCYTGHIGALCEQCDLYNIRGGGSYSISTNYTCGKCENMLKNVVLIAAISIWTLFTIFISVKSTLKAIQQCMRINTLLLFRITMSQAAILIKMLTNYLQILATISTFQLVIPVGIDNTISAAGNPIQTMAYSSDCLLIHLFSFEIHYSRMIWQMILPFIYIQLFLFFYFIGIKTKLIKYNSSVPATTLIYMYIYLQPNLVGGLVQLISFRKISGFSWIQANISYRYDTRYHLLWILELCLPSLLIIALLIPLFMFKGLYDRKSKLHDKGTRLIWGYLYNEYKGEAYFWEIVKIVEKQLIIIFLTYYQDNVVIKGILIQIIVFLYYLLNKKYSPYSSQKLNNLDAYSAQICMISIAMGVGLYISQGSGLLEIQIPFLFLLSVINISFLVIIISRILMEYIREVNKSESKLDVLRDRIRYRFPFLQSIPFFKRILANRIEKKNRIAKLYKKLKQFLLFQARQILTFKEQQWQTAITLFTEGNPNTLGTIRESAERQRFLRNNNTRQSSLSHKTKTISNYFLEKMKFNQIDQIETGDKREEDKLGQQSKNHYGLFQIQNQTQN